MAATIGAMAIVVAAVLLQSTNQLNPLSAFRAFRISSGSMCPTLCEGDRIIADVRGFRSQEPQRGEVVMFLFDRESTLHVKRVVAAGGDEVANTQADVVVNGSPVRLPTSACGTSIVRTSSEIPPSAISESCGYQASNSLWLEMTWATAMTAVFTGRSMRVGLEESQSMCTGPRKQIVLGAP